MHPNAQRIQTFYEAFQKLDATAMNACYAPGVVFSDPVFPRLEGDRARAMWSMLAKRAKEFELTFEGVSADDHTGRAHWEARYLFSKTGRRVHNVIDAEFTFKDGLVVTHTDRFDLWRWSRQALGPAGLVLGWTPFLQAKLRGEAERGLDAFMRDQKKARASAN